MEIKKGIGVSPGVVISTAVVLDAEDLAIPRRHVEEKDVEAEVARFKGAVDKSMKELLELRDRVSEKYSKEIGGIFNFHLGIIADKSVVEPIQQTIRAQKVTAEFAVSVVMRRFASNFKGMADRYFADRVKDIYDIERRVL